MSNGNQNESVGYIAPLRFLDAKPSAGDTFEAKRTALFSGSHYDTLTVVNVEERYVADGSGQKHSGFYCEAPGDDTRTLYVVTLEKPNGERFEAQDWQSNLGW